MRQLRLARGAAELWCAATWIQTTGAVICDATKEAEPDSSSIHLDVRRPLSAGTVICTELLHPYSSHQAD